MAKQVLPWFGGSAAVWTTCMVFFQVLLVCGYGYADASVRMLSARRQAAVHATLLVASLASLPITLRASLAPEDASSPAGRVLYALAVTVGLPYLMLSTTGPLVQAWSAPSGAGARVYRLYALSNAASLVALLGYPTLIEPRATCRAQAIAWSVGYALFVVLGLATAWKRARAEPGAATAAEPAQPVPSPLSPGDATTPADAPGRRTQATWLLLAGLGSVLLLSVTTHITQNIASVPFLWVVPLALYLVSFILCFDDRGWYRRGAFTVLGWLAVVAMLGAMSWHFDWASMRFKREVVPIREAIVLYPLGLFVLLMFCHGELASRRPSPAHLTRFYFMVSLGGALGGLAVGVVAPSVFDGNWELPLALVGAALLTLFLAPERLRPFAAATLCVTLVGVADYVAFIRWDTLASTRNFYGALRVRRMRPTSNDGATQEQRVLLHGIIVHGAQFTAPERARRPTTYYGETSGVGRAILALREARARPLSYGLVGLGAGTLASYGQKADVLRVYELDPDVVRLSREKFSFTAESPATIAVVLGDARLSLAREPAHRFDLLAVDAFSGDAIPTHLLTREAALAYRRHMADDGVVAVHISNNYLDLSGVVRSLADAIGWDAVQVDDKPAPGEGTLASVWVLVTRDEELIGRLERGGGSRLAARAGGRAWTDDHNDLLDVLK